MELKDLHIVKLESNFVDGPLYWLNFIKHLIKKYQGNSWTNDTTEEEIQHTINMELEFHKCIFKNSTWLLIFETEQDYLKFVLVWG